MRTWRDDVWVEPDDDQPYSPFEVEFSPALSEFPEDDPWAGFRVFLPHQCDSWIIVEGTKDKTEAVAAFEGFIAAAQSALEHLKALET